MKNKSSMKSKDDFLLVNHMCKRGIELSSANQHATPPEFGGKRGQNVLMVTECLNVVLALCSQVPLVYLSMCRMKREAKKNHV